MSKFFTANVISRLARYWGGWVGGGEVGDGCGWEGSGVGVVG